MEYCAFYTEQEIQSAVKATKEMETNLNIKFTKKEFDEMVLTLLDPLLTVN